MNVEVSGPGGTFIPASPQAPHLPLLQTECDNRKLPARVHTAQESKKREIGTEVPWDHNSLPRNNQIRRNRARARAQRTKHAKRVNRASTRLDKKTQTPSSYGNSTSDSEATASEPHESTDAIIKNLTRATQQNNTVEGNDALPHPMEWSPKSQTNPNSKTRQRSCPEHTSKETDGSLENNPAHKADDPHQAPETKSLHPRGNNSSGSELEQEAIDKATKQLGKKTMRVVSWNTKNALKIYQRRK